MKKIIVAIVVTVTVMMALAATLIFTGILSIPGREPEVITGKTEDGTWVATIYRGDERTDATIEYDYPMWEEVGMYDFKVEMEFDSKLTDELINELNSTGTLRL